MSGAAARLAIVIVSFNTRDLLAACLTSLRADLDRSGLDADTHVVDNASSDGSAERVAADFPWVRLHRPGRNLGFTAGNNLALRDILAAGPAAPPWILLLNPDTEIRRGALGALLAAAEADPRVAVAGPALVYADCAFQQAAFGFPGILQAAFDLFPPQIRGAGRLLESRLNGRYPRRSYAAGRPFLVDFVLGACMLVRTAALREVGLLDEGYFMYAEEVDWCRRFAAAGWGRLCVPGALVMHHGGAASGQFRARSWSILWQSRRRYLRRHEPAWRVRAVEGLLRLAVARRRRADRAALAAGLLPAEEAAARAAAYDAALAPLAEGPATSTVEPRQGDDDPGAVVGSPSDCSRIMKSALTAVVLTLNEAPHLPDCLRSLKALGCPVLVLDSCSQDGSQAIARAAGARVEERAFVNYSVQRQAALDLVTTPWLLFVDADERVSEALAAAVGRAIGRDDAAAPAAYWIARRNDFWGHALQGGGWWPDHQLRLLRVARARYAPERAVHELAEVDGPLGRIDEPLLHLNYESWSEFWAKQRAYARLEAGRRRAAGLRPRPHHYLLQPLREFRRRFFTLGGYRDGLLGLRLCLAMGAAEGLTLWWSRP